MAFKYGEKHEWELPHFRESYQLPDAGDLWSVKFYPYNKPGVDPIFAVVGGKYILICRVPQGSKGFEVIKSILDEEAEADHFACAWTKDLETGTPILCVAGHTGKILIIDALTGELQRAFAGHGGPINDLAISPINPQILASASDDQTVRIWTLRAEDAKQPCAAILAGDGHRDTIQSISWHETGRYIISGGIDRQIILWVVPEFPDKNTGTNKPTRIFYPHFSTSEIHYHIVDCVMFHHDLIISKAEREWNIVLWSITGFNSKHPPPSPLTAPTVHDMDNDTRSAFSPPSSPMYSRLLQFSIPDTDVMFMRFGFYPGNPDPRFGGGLSGPVLAMCNSSSKVLFFDFRRLEEHHDYIQALENTTAATQALPSATDSTSPTKANSTAPDIKRPPFLIPFKSRNRGGSHIRAIDRIAASHGSPSSSERSTTMPDEKEKSTAAADEKKSRENWGHRYFIGDSQKDLLPHKEEMVKGLNFVGRQIAWSTGGEWCVVVGSAGVISIFERWGGK